VLTDYRHHGIPLQYCMCVYMCGYVLSGFRFLDMGSSRYSYMVNPRLQHFHHLFFSQNMPVRTQTDACTFQSCLHCT
jgi:hypothetical protein